MRGFESRRGYQTIGSKALPAGILQGSKAAAAPPPLSCPSDPGRLAPLLRLRPSRDARTSLVSVSGPLCPSAQCLTEGPRDGSSGAAAGFAQAALGGGSASINWSKAFALTEGVLLSQLFFFAVAANGTPLLLRTERYATEPVQTLDTGASLCIACWAVVLDGELAVP